MDFRGTIIAESWTVAPLKHTAYTLQATAMTAGQSNFSHVQIRPQLSTFIFEPLATPIESALKLVVAPYFILLDDARYFMNMTSVKR